MKFEDTLSHPLDDWQKDAIDSMNQRHSVFAAVPTGSGKSILAEYAIFSSRKVIYTAPLKAISNQKYHDFSKKFKSVGILTGDVQMNEDADVLIMTTEVLRKMIGAKDPRLDDIDWIVFDEVHYMSDEDRGTVWEESFILLPDSIRCVFLSATVSNAHDFSFWFSKMHNHPVDVISISKRPVPLSFHVATEKDVLDIDRFDTIKNDSPTIMNEKVLKLLKQKELLPAIIFSCSKVRIENLAKKLSTAQLLTTYESNNVKKKFDDLLRKTAATDDFYMKYRNYAAQGVGVHHAGMLPYVKEIIEHLFCSGMLQVLVSTETFAMGVNGPSRSVVFESLTKFDGYERRLFLPHEFIQMAGRAGRRGFDDHGHVIVLHDPNVPRGEMSKLINGRPRPLRSTLTMSSQFVLQCIQRTIDIKNVIKSSFDSFNMNIMLPTIDDIQKARSYERQVKLWITILSHPSVRPYMMNQKCILENGEHGTIVETRPDYKVEVDGRVQASKIEAIIDAPFKKMKIRDIDVQLAIKSLHPVEKPEKYQEILNYSRYDDHQKRLIGDYEEIFAWLKDELLVENGMLSPLGEIASQISSLCPVLGTKLLNENESAASIMAAISTFPAERTEASGEPVIFSLEMYCPEFVDWNLVRACLDWYHGHDLLSICSEYNMFEGNVVQILLQIKNTLNELILVSKSQKLKTILEKIDRNEVRIKSLYLS